jgi:hypothetical protein
LTNQAISRSSEEPPSITVNELRSSDSTKPEVTSLGLWRKKLFEAATDLHGPRSAVSVISIAAPRLLKNIGA